MVVVVAMAEVGAEKSDGKIEGAVVVAVAIAGATVEVAGAPPSVPSPESNVLGAKVREG